MAYTTTADLRNYLDLTGKSTFTADAGTDLLTLADIRTANAVNKNNVQVQFETTDTLPAPLAVDTVYFVVAQDVKTTIKVTTTNDGAAIDITDAGVGTHTLYRAPSDEDVLQDCIDDATAYINAETHRVFEAETTTKYYDRDNLQDDGITLWFPDDLLTVTTLTNGDDAGTVIAAADYTLMPRNESPPYHAIRLDIDASTTWEFDTDQWVSVAGTWGWSATVPDDIKRATLRLAAFYYRQKDAQVFETTAIPEAGVITIPQAVPRDVGAIIAKYKKYMWGC